MRAITLLSIALLCLSAACKDKGTDPPTSDISVVDVSVPDLADAGDAGDAGDGGDAGSDGDDGGDLTDGDSASDAPDSDSDSADLDEPDALPEAVIRPEGIHINELLVSPAAVLPPALPGMQWVELFYAGPEPYDLGALELLDIKSDGDERLLTDFPSVEMPAGSFLTIRFVPFVVALDADVDGEVVDDLGLENDLDFSDGQGTIFTDVGGIFSTDVGGIFSTDVGGVFSTERGDLALVDSALGSMAFLAWGTPFDGGPSSLETSAVDAAQWAAGERVDLTGLSDGSTIGLHLDGLHSRIAERAELLVGMVSPEQAGADDYRRFEWEDFQPLGLSQPANPLQLAPSDGSMRAAFPVTFSWRACPGADAYTLEVADGPDFESAVSVVREGTTETSLELDDPGFNPLYWRVSCRYADGRVRTPFSPAWRVLVAPPEPGPDDPPLLTVTHQYQHKDTPMLCLYDARNGDGPGCAESLTPPEASESCDWNAPHPVPPAVARVSDCGPIARYYGGRAAIQMVHHFFDATALPGDDPRLSQDVISWLTFSDRDPVGVADASGPEGQLGVGLQLGVDDIIRTLSIVLGISPDNVELVEEPDFDVLSAAVLDGRPTILLLSVEGAQHELVVYGVRSTPEPVLFVHDPARRPDPGQADTLPATALDRFDALALIPPAAVGTLEIDPGGLFADLDTDGLSNFDEGNGRLCSNPERADSDGDYIDDYDEVFHYTFGRGPNAIASCGRTGSGFCLDNIDDDLLRPECDCDSDGDDDPDGAEDIDGDGGRDEPGGVGVAETDMLASGSSELDLGLTSDFYLQGEEVAVQGGTLAAAATYPTLTTTCDEALGFGEVLVEDGDITTDADGIIDAGGVFTCARPGCHQVHLGLTDDGVFAECDRAFAFECVCLFGDPNTFDDAGDITDAAGAPYDPITPSAPIVDIHNVDYSIVVDAVGEQLIVVIDGQVVNTTPQFAEPVLEIMLQIEGEAGAGSLRDQEYLAGAMYRGFAFFSDAGPATINWQRFNGVDGFDNIAGQPDDGLLQASVSTARVNLEQGFVLSLPPDLPLIAGTRRITGLKVASRPDDLSFADFFPNTADGRVPFISLDSCEIE